MKKTDDKYSWINESRKLELETNEQNAKEKFNDLVSLSHEILGDQHPINYKELTEDSLKYLSEAYFVEYLSSTFPVHSNPDKVGLLGIYTQFTPGQINAALEAFNVALAACNRFAPIVGKDSLESVIKTDDYTYKIKDRKLYDATLYFINSINALTKLHVGSSSIHLLIASRFEQTCKENMNDWSVNIEKFI